MKLADMEPVTRSWIPRLYLIILDNHSALRHIRVASKYEFKERPVRVRNTDVEVRRSHNGLGR